jgi:hypothetical protein
MCGQSMDCAFFPAFTAMGQPEKVTDCCWGQAEPNKCSKYPALRSQWPENLFKIVGGQSFRPTASSDLFSYTNISRETAPLRLSFTNFITVNSKNKLGACFKTNALLAVID